MNPASSAFTKFVFITSSLSRQLESSAVIDPEASRHLVGPRQSERPNDRQDDHGQGCEPCSQARNRVTSGSVFVGVKPLERLHVG